MRKDAQMRLGDRKTMSARPTWHQTGAERHPRRLCAHALEGAARIVAFGNMYITPSMPRPPVPGRSQWPRQESPLRRSRGVTTGISSGRSLSRTPQLKQRMTLFKCL